MQTFWGFYVEWLAVVFLIGGLRSLDLAEEHEKSINPGLHHKRAVLSSC
jgi:hypothetical protein